jgi:hypothetical protein
MKFSYLAICLLMLFLVLCEYWLADSRQVQGVAGVCVCFVCLCVCVCVYVCCKRV